MVRRCGAQPKFSESEDKKLKELVTRLGSTSWNTIAKQFKDKSPKQCRDRWRNYVDPDLRHDEWSVEEDQMLIEKFKEFGSKWTVMTAYFNHRSANDIRYRWMKLSRISKFETSPQTPPEPMIIPEIESLPPEAKEEPQQQTILKSAKRVIIPLPPILTLIPREAVQQTLKLDFLSNNLTYPF